MSTSRSSVASGRSGSASTATASTATATPAGSYLHVAIDDHTRLAYAELLKDERGPSCAAFLRRATAWYAERGITVERVLSDNGKAYHGRHWQAACAELGISAATPAPTAPGPTAKPKR